MRTLLLYNSNPSCRLSLIEIESGQSLLRSNNLECPQLADSRIDTRSVSRVHFSDQDTIVSLDRITYRKIYF